MPRRHFTLLLLAFALSVAVRWPLLNRPLSAHHELCTALVLIILHNWRTDGFLHHHGAPAITFSGGADLIPPGYTDAPALHEGVLYYLSHPPLAYDLPYVLFTLTGTEANALGLQIFNLFFHLLTALALYLIVLKLPQKEGSRAPLFAAVLYLFMPAPLWFHGNVYMSDMFVQNAWVWHILVVLQLYKRGTSGWRWPLLAGLTLLITTMISWPGVWAGITLIGIALFRWWRTRNAQELRIALVAVLAIGAALSYTAWRWLQVVDAEALWAYYTGRFADRGTTFHGGEWSALRELLIGYRTGYLPVIILVAAFVVLRWRRMTGGLGGWRLFIALSAIPVLLDHLLLMQYSAHDFAALKGGPFLCAAAAVGLSALSDRWALPLAAATCVAGMLYFYKTNWINAGPDERSFPQRDLGLTIARDATRDEMVFTIGLTPEPQVQWYAKRTFFRVNDLYQAQDLMRAAGKDHGLVVQDHVDGRTMTRISIE